MVIIMIMHGDDDDDGDEYNNDDGDDDYIAIQYNYYVSANPKHTKPLFFLPAFFLVQERLEPIGSLCKAEHCITAPPKSTYRVVSLS